jgi:hypothetical protein
VGSQSHLPPKAEPVIDWSEIELRLQEISAPARAPADLSDLLIELSATLRPLPMIHQRQVIYQTRDQPMNNSDPIDVLSCRQPFHPDDPEERFVSLRGDTTSYHLPILRRCKVRMLGTTEALSE